MRVGARIRRSWCVRLAQGGKAREFDPIALHAAARKRGRLDAKHYNELGDLIPRQLNAVFYFGDERTQRDQLVAQNL